MGVLYSGMTLSKNNIATFKTYKMDEKKIKDHYTDLFKEHGVSERSVQYTDKYSQYARFYVLTQFIQKKASIVDVGCGLGDLYSFLLSRGFSGSYHGMDIVPEFIEHCQDQFNDHSKASFSLISNNEDYPSKFDFFVLSGVFNNRRSNNLDFMFTTLIKMFDACKIGMSFNCMSSYVDFKDQNLFYCSPEEIFKFVKHELKGHPILVHNYVLKEKGFPHDYTITVFKEPHLPKLF